MRFANLLGRAVILVEARALDLERASGGRLPSDPAHCFARWDEVSAWVREGAYDIADATPFEPKDLGPPSPRPWQVFALGLNYAPHAAEAGFTPPSVPVVFTKFPSCLSGPDTTVELRGTTVDWEVELVAVVGRTASRVHERDAWNYVAGLTVGQDLSDRDLQSAAAPPQFSLAKSFPGFGPTGPVLVTLDELSTPDDLEIACELNGATVQRARTSEMIFSVPTILAELSAVCTLWPGDLVFTGTPGGVGHRRQPPRYLRAGDELVSRIESIGDLRQKFGAAPG